METTNLILRDWQEHDAKALHEMCLDGLLRKSGIDFYDSVVESQNAIHCWQNSKGFKVIADRRNDSFIEQMLDYGFKDMNLSVVAAWVRSHNRASISVLEKCSFTFEGRLRQHARDKSDTLCYSILREEWKESNRL